MSSRDHAEPEGEGDEGCVHWLALRWLELELTRPR